MSKIAPSGAQGNMRLLKAYGGGSTPPRQAYADGGKVGNPSLDEGLAAAGDMGKEKSGKGKDKKDGKGKTDIVINVVSAKDAAPPPPTGAAGLAPPPPMPMPPPGPMAAGPGPMPGPGMPMRASGGRVKKADGGAMDDPIPAYLREGAKKKKESAGMHNVTAAATGALALGAPEVVTKSLLGANAALNAGMGKIDRMDAKDLKRGAKAFEATGLPGRPEREERASGGSVKTPTTKGMLSEPGFQGGGAGAMGRLEKIKAYGKK